MRKKNTIQSLKLQQIITQSKTLINQPKLLEPQQPIIQLNTFGNLSLPPIYTING